MKRVVVSETHATPKLGVKPLRSAPVSEAVSQSFVIVTVELFPTVRPVPEVLIERPDSRKGSAWGSIECYSS